MGNDQRPIKVEARVVLNGEPQPEIVYDVPTAQPTESKPAKFPDRMIGSVIGFALIIDSLFRPGDYGGMQTNIPAAFELNERDPFRDLFLREEQPAASAPPEFRGDCLEGCQVFEFIPGQSHLETIVQPTPAQIDALRKSHPYAEAQRILAGELLEGEPGRGHLVYFDSLIPKPTPAERLAQMISDLHAQADSIDGPYAHGSVWQQNEGTALRQRASAYELALADSAPRAFSEPAETPEDYKITFPEYYF